MSRDIFINLNHLSLVVIMAILILLIITEVKRLKIKNLFKKKNRLERTNMQYGQNHQDIKITFSKVERLQIRYIQKSGIKEHFPFIDIYSLFIFNFYIGCSFAFLVFIKFRILGVALVFFIIGSTLSFVVIDVIKVNKQKKIRLSMPALLSSMSRWSAINEDVIFCMNKCLSSEISNEIKKIFKNFLVKINTGTSIDTAFIELENKCEGEFFREFIIHLKQATKNRGDLRRLIMSLEEESYRVESEIDKRFVSLYKYKLTVVFLIIMIIISGYTLIMFNDFARGFYLESLIGNGVLAVFLLVFYICIVLLFSFNVSEV